MTIEQDQLSDYLSVFRRRAKLFFGTLAAITATAVTVALALPDVYRSTAELRIDLEGTGVDLLEPLALTTYADQYVRSLQQKALAFDKLSAWLDESGVYADERERTTAGNLVGRMLDDIRIEMVTIGVLGRDGREVELITGFTTAFEGPEPEPAYFINDRVANAFLAEDRAMRTERAAAASEFLGEQIETQRLHIVELEAQIAEFKQLHAESLPELRGLAMSVLERTERDIESVQNDIRTRLQDKIFREAQLEEIRRSSASAERLAQLEDEYLRAIAIYGEDHPDVIRIRRQVAALTGGLEGQSENPEIAQLQAELAAARQRYTDEHPDVVSLQRRIESLRLQDRARGAGGATTDPLYLQLRAQVNALDSELVGLRERLSELRARSDKSQDSLAVMPQVEREYLALTRDLQTAQLAFDDLRGRLATAQQTESFESGERGARLTLVSRASLPDEPTGPPRVAIAVLGAILATTLALAAALGSEALDVTIRGARDIRNLLQMEPIVAVPIVRNSASRRNRRWRLMGVAVIFIIGITAIVALTGFGV